MANQRTPSTFSDVLESQATARFVDILSHGEIEGLVNSSDELQSVYVDRNPVKTSAGEFNYPNVLLDFKEGTPIQSFLQGFTEIASPVSNADAGLGNAQGFRITKGGNLSVGDTKDQSAQDYVYATSDGDVDALLVQITISSLISINDDGEQYGNDTRLSIHTRSLGSTFITPSIVSSSRREEGNIVGKVLSPYSITYRVQRPDSVGPTDRWEVLVRKRSPDDDYDVNKKADSIFVTGITEIIEHKERYENLSVAGLTVPASEDNSASISGIEYDVYGMIVDMPNVYNATTRTMGNGWNGVGMKQAYTNCPAWCLLSLINNSEYGMGIPYSEIDVYSFVEFANFCDEILQYTDTDGSDINAPRFSCNMQMTDQQDPITRLQSFAGIYRSYIVLDGGLITVISDKQKDKSSVVTTTATVDGFNYSFTDISQRISVIRARFLDEELDFVERVIEERDDAGIALYGEMVQEVTLQGLTNEAEVRRHCRYILERTLRNTRVVTFQTGFTSANFRVGDRISIIDNDLINLGGSFGSGTYDPELDEQSSGRTVAGSNTLNTNVDRPVDLSSGSNWKIGRLDDNGDVLEANVTSVSVVSGVTRIKHSQWRFVSDNSVSNFAAPANRQWYIYTGAAEPADYEVVSITESTEEFGSFTVVGKEYRDESFSNIDVGVQLPSRPLTNYESSNLPAPIFTVEATDTDGTGYFPENFYNATTDTTSTNLRLVWKPANNDDLISEYFLRWAVNSSEWNYVTTKNTEYTVSDAPKGFYDMRLVAKSVLGVESPAVIVEGYDFENLAAAVSSLTRPTELRLKGGARATTGTIDFTEANLTVEFDVDGSNDLNLADPLQGYVVEYFAGDGSGLIASHVVNPTAFRSEGSLKIFEDTLTVAENLSSFQGFKADGSPKKSNGLQRNLNVKIYATDIHGKRIGGDTTGTARTFFNAFPAGVTFDTFVNSTSEIRVTLNANTTDDDLAGYFILKGDDDTVPFGNAAQRLAAVENGSVEVIHTDPSLRTFTSAEQQKDYIFYVCPYDTMTNDLNHYLTFGNWNISAVQTAPAISIDIEEFENYLGDCRIDERFVNNAFQLQPPFDGLDYNTTGSNRVISIAPSGVSIQFNRADSSKIIFDSFDNFSNHDYVRSSPDNTQDNGEQYLYVYISIPNDTHINNNRVLVDAASNLYRYTGNLHKIKGTTELKEAIAERQVIIAQHNRNTNAFIVNGGAATVHGNRVTAQTIGTNTLIAGGVDADRLVARSITSQQIATNAITANEIQANAITTVELAADAVKANNIDAGAVTADSVGANEIVASKANIKTAAVDTLSVAQNSITTTIAGSYYHAHLWKPNAGSGAAGSWIHRSSATDSTIQGLIKGVGGTQNGTPITTSNMNGFQTLFVYIPPENTIGSGNVDVILQINAILAMRSKVSSNWHMASNLSMYHEWTGTSGTVSGLRVLPDISTQANNCVANHHAMTLTATLKYSIPVHPNPALSNVVRFRLDDNNLAFFNPSYSGGASAGSNSQRAAVWRYGMVLQPSYTATVFLR